MKGQHGNPGKQRLSIDVCRRQTAAAASVLHRNPRDEDRQRFVFKQTGGIQLMWSAPSAVSVCVRRVRRQRVVRRLRRR